MSSFLRHNSGMVICEPGSIEPALKVRANIYILTKDEGGTGKPLKHMGQEMIFSRTFDCMAATLYDNPDQRIMPGENGEMNLVFRTPMVSSTFELLNFIIFYRLSRRETDSQFAVERRLLELV